MKKIKLTCRVLPIVGALAMVMTSCGGSQQQQMGGGVEAATMTVALSETSLFSEYPAVIKGKVDVQVRPQVSGFITKVCVSEGETVRKGQLLFVIDQVQYQAAVSQAEASVAAAQEAVNSAQITARNKQTLYNKNVISEYENQLAQNDLASAKAGLSQANAALVSARKNLSYTVVKAPSAGYVGSIPNREGSLASPSMAQPLTTVSDISEVYAYISFNERQVLEMTQSGNVTLANALKEMPAVRLKLADGSYYASEGKFSTMTGLLDTTTGSATVRVCFPNQNGMLRSGSTGSVVIPTHMDNVIIIPQSATTEIQDRKFAYLTDKEGNVKSCAIEVVATNDGKSYAVTSGLKDGDHVIVEGVGVSVRDGVKIQPVDKTNSQNAAEAK